MVKSDQLQFQLSEEKSDLSMLPEQLNAVVKSDQLQFQDTSVSTGDVVVVVVTTDVVVVSRGGGLMAVSPNARVRNAAICPLVT